MCLVLSTLGGLFFPLIIRDKTEHVYSFPFIYQSTSSLNISFSKHRKYGICLLRVSSEGSPSHSTDSTSLFSSSLDRKEGMRRVHQVSKEECYSKYVPSVSRQCVLKWIEGADACDLSFKEHTCTYYTNTQIPLERFNQKKNHQNLTTRMSGVLIRTELCSQGSQTNSFAAFKHSVVPSSSSRSYLE